MTDTVKIKGMSCNHCVMAVRKALNEIPGVSNVDVNLDKGEATYDRDASVSPELIRERIEKAQDSELGAFFRELMLSRNPAPSGQPSPTNPGQGGVQPASPGARFMQGVGLLPGGQEPALANTAGGVTRLSDLRHKLLLKREE